MTSNAPFPQPDWWEINDYDEQEFYGYDNGDGTTTWYTPDGCLDCITPTPDEFDPKIWNGTLKKL